MADPIGIKDSDSSLKNLKLFSIRVKIYLRLRSVFIKAYRSTMFGTTFDLINDYTCWTTAICGTLKDDSLQIDISAPIFSVTEMASTLCHFMETIFVKKLKILHSSDLTICSNCASIWSKYLIK